MRSLTLLVIFPTPPSLIVWGEVELHDVRSWVFPQNFKMEGKLDQNEMTLLKFGDSVTK